MIEKALTGSKRYWGWMALLSAVAGIGFVCYLFQFTRGLGITGLSRDVSWGLYIGQFTFLVGIAASGVMLVLPYYLHDFKKFGKITVLGEFLAVSAVLMCMLFVMADMGQPMRFMNIMLHPTPNSVFFWDFMVLAGYLAMNIIIAWTVLHADKKEVAPPSWVKPLIYLSILWAPSLHTVTAFIYAGIPGKHFWLSAILAARFLASAFASGPSLLILLCFLIRRVSRFDPGTEAIQRLAMFVTYFMITNVFFLGLEAFTALYSNIPGHMHAFQYLYVGIEGHNKMVPLMWTSTALAVVALVLLVNPSTRKNERTLAVAAAATFLSLMIDKGFGLVTGGFVPNSFETVTEYWPTLPETLISLGIWAAGLLVLTVLYKIVIAVREEAAEPSH